MRYVYSLVRYVPRPASGEYVNVAAIVGNDETGDWDVRTVANQVRARQLGQHGPSLAAVFDRIARIGQLLEDHRMATDLSLVDETGVSESWLRHLHATSQNVLQFSEPVPVRAESSQDALDMVFDSLVLDLPEPSRRAGYRNKATARNALRAAFTHAGVPSTALREGASLEVRLPLGLVESPIDFIVFNGRAVQMSQAVSFQLPDQDGLARELRSWTLGLAALRDDHGTAEALIGGRSIAVPHEVDVEVLFVPPLPGTSDTVMGQALSYFDLYDIKARPIDDAAGVAQVAADLLTTAGVKLLDVTP